MILVDTCGLLACAMGQLPLAAQNALLDESAEGRVALSIAAWEIAGKYAVGKLPLTMPPLDVFQQVCHVLALRMVDLDARTGCAAAALPPHHRDPADRLMIAWALHHEALVITSDPLWPTYGVRTLWAAEPTPRKSGRKR